MNTQGQAIQHAESSRERLQLQKRQSIGEFLTIFTHQIKQIFDSELNIIGIGSKHSVAFSSGSAATSAVIHLLSPGEKVLSIDDVYGGTQR